MKKNYCSVLVLMALSFSTNAEVFKCKDKAGKIIYQGEPCTSGEVPQGVINVKQMTPEETEAAKTKLKVWQEQQAIEDAERRAAEKEQQAELERQESLELQRRSVRAQEQQAITAQQRPYMGGGGVYLPSYGVNNRYYWGNQPYPPFGTLNPYSLPRQPINTWNQNVFPQQQPNTWNPNMMPYQQPLSPSPQVPTLIPQPATPLIGTQRHP